MEKEIIYITRKKLDESGSEQITRALKEGAYAVIVDAQWPICCDSQLYSIIMKSIKKSDTKIFGGFSCHDEYREPLEKMGKYYLNTAYAIVSRSGRVSPFYTPRKTLDESSTLEDVIEDLVEQEIKRVEFNMDDLKKEARKPVAK